MQHTTTELEIMPPAPERWTVRTKYQDSLQTHVKHYELRYRGTVQDRRKGLHAYEVLKLTAKHLNRINAVPRPRIQCAADAPCPDAYLAKHAW